jgi:hypothetical protein
MTRAPLQWPQHARREPPDPLTKIKRAPTPPDIPVLRDIHSMPDIPRIDLTGMREGDGRNPTLFDILCDHGKQLPPTIEAFIDFAREENLTCAQPMDDDEVIQIADNISSTVSTARCAHGSAAASGSRQRHHPHRWWRTTCPCSA